MSKYLVSKFLIIGLFNTLIGVAIYSLMYFFVGNKFGAVACAITSHLIASSTGFFMQSKLVFNVRENSVRKYILFQAGYILPVTLGSLFLYVLVDLLETNPYGSQAFLSILFASFSFLWNKNVTFRPRN